MTRGRIVGRCEVAVRLARGPPMRVDSLLHVPVVMLRLVAEVLLLDNPLALGFPSSSVAAVTKAS